MLISPLIIVTTISASDKICGENQNTQFIFPLPLPPPENRAVYDIMWKNIVQPGRPQMTM
jgi:hypothetical protein